MLYMIIGNNYHLYSLFSVRFTWNFSVLLDAFVEYERADHTAAFVHRKGYILHELARCEEWDACVVACGRNMGKRNTQSSDPLFDPFSYDDKLYDVNL